MNICGFICKFYWVLLKVFLNFQFINFALYVTTHKVHILSDPYCLSLPFGSFIIYKLVYPVPYSHTSYWIACCVCILLAAISNPFCKIYRVIQEESAILWEMIVCVILSKNVHVNMGPILSDYRNMVKRRYGPSCEHEQQLRHK